MSNACCECYVITVGKNTGDCDCWPLASRKHYPLTGSGLLSKLTSFMIGVNVYREEGKGEHFRGMEQVPQQEREMYILTELFTAKCLSEDACV